MKSLIIFAYTALLCIAVISFISCDNKGNDIKSKIDKAETLMESDPVSALEILDSINTNDLNSEKARARYALLKSMAIDKNYIDTTNFSILQPAINYYSSKGEANEKLRTLYYQGRIHQNRGENDIAMNLFVAALDLSEEATDTLTIARTLAAQAVLYRLIYDFKAEANNYLKAAELYEKKGNHYWRIQSLFNVLNSSISTDDKHLADSIMEVCQQEVYGDSLLEQEFIPYMLIYKSNYSSKKELEESIEKYAESNSVSPDMMLSIAKCYIDLGEYREALLTMDQLNQSGIPYDTLRYSALGTTAYESLGDYRQAYDQYHNFSSILSDRHITLFNQKLQFSEERYKLKLQAQKESERKDSIIYQCIAGLMILMLVIIILIYAHRNVRLKKEQAEQAAKLAIIENEKSAIEAENLRHRINDLESEYEHLSELLKSNGQMPEEVKKAISKRVDMLNDFFAAIITDNNRFGSSYDNWVKEIVSDSEYFMNSNRLAFQACHPSFIKYFIDHGLTDNEINYVCLYALGLNGKEVGAFIKRRGHVNTSSIIRKKLGLTNHDTNISIFVRNLLHDL